MVLVHFGAPFTARKSKILLKTEVSAKTAFVGISNNVSPRSQKSQFFVKLSKKTKKGPQIEPKLSPMGLCQRVIRNSYIAYNRTFYLYFLDAKFQLLGICSSQLYPEETTIFGSWPCWAQFGGFGAITPVNNIRLSWNFDQKEFS